MQALGDGGEVAAREERFEPAQERRVGRERVDERAVQRAGLLDDDLAVALDDVRLDLADVLVDERLEGLLAREDARARLADAGGAERVGRSRPAELRRPALGAPEAR